jgi:ligand-binding SRPBCC domain-containing protein
MLFISGTKDFINQISNNKNIINMYNHNELISFLEGKINSGLQEVWDFISFPENLKKIIPEYMGFNITSPLTSEKMYPGMIISYEVTPLFGIKTTWVTEKTGKGKAIFC